MKKIQSFFLARNLREKILMTAFVAMAAAVGLNSTAHRLGAEWTVRRSALKDLEIQQLWLDDQARIEQRAGQAVKSLDPEKTFDATRLVAEVSTLAGQAGLSVNTDAPRTQRTEQFAFHTVQVNFRKVSLAALVGFYQALGERAPYLSLAQFRVQADRADPSQLNVSLQIASVEMVAK